MDVFEAIADPTRRHLIDECSHGERTAGDLAASLQSMSRPNVSRHVRVLVGVGILTERRDAQRRLFRLKHDGLGEVDHWLSRYRGFWQERIHALDEVVRHADG